MEARVHLKGWLAWQQVIDRPCQLVRQDGQGLPLVVFVLHAGHLFLPGWMVAPAQHRGLGKGPRELGVTNFWA